MMFRPQRARQALMQLANCFSAGLRAESCAGMANVLPVCSTSYCQSPVALICAGLAARMHAQAAASARLLPKAPGVLLRSGISSLPCSSAASVALQGAISSSGCSAAQLLQRRFLLGVKAKAKTTNYQQHFGFKPHRASPRNRRHWPTAARHRFIMKGGVIMRLQAGRRHYRSKKSKNALRRLKGLVPLHKPIARKLKKLGFKRTWWHMQK